MDIAIKLVGLCVIYFILGMLAHKVWADWRNLLKLQAALRSAKREGKDHANP